MYNLEAVDVRQRDVEHDGVGLQPRKLKSVASSGRLAHIEACVAQGPRYDVPGGWVVVHHQDGLHPGLDFLKFRVAVARAVDRNQGAIPGSRSNGALVKSVSSFAEGASPFA